MQGHLSRQELYEKFIGFVISDQKHERSTVQRRMFSVFVWCFLVPAGISLAVLLLTKLGFFPRSLRFRIDWLILLFPMIYSLYILSSEVLVKMPRTFKSGGIASVLGQSIQDSAWRERVCDAMARTVEAQAEEWDWLIESFKIDLKNLQYRTRFLTALGGAVLYLIMQGLDTLGDTEAPVAWTRTTMLGWIEAQSNGVEQFVALGLFLVLLYLAGNQTFHSLERYLNCAELIRKQKKP